MVRLLLQHESNLHVHSVLDDFAVFNNHLLVLDPSASQVFQGLAGALDSEVQSIFEAFGRGCCDFCNSCDGHEGFSFPLLAGLVLPY